MYLRFIRMLGNIALGLTAEKYLRLRLRLRELHPKAIVVSRVSSFFVGDVDIEEIKSDWLATEV